MVVPAPCEPASDGRKAMALPMHISRALRITGALVALGTVLAVFLSAGAEAPAPGPIERAWARTDLPVLEGQAQRTWIWAPQAFTMLMTEPYVEAPGGQRQVQYFDKSRMEITDPDGDPDSPWFVTNGLLVLEMTEGYIQTGHEASEPRELAGIPVAGDPDSPDAPTYRTVAGLMNQPPGSEGDVLIARVDGAGNISEDPALAAHGVTLGPDATELGRPHRTASVFWEFMHTSGTIWDGEQFTTAPLFENPYYATGLPLAPPYWARVHVGGTPKDVLFQCFERRCLTYTPDNPEGWQVETGNVGLHYYNWRYPAGDPAPTPTETAPPAPPGETQSPTATATPTGVEPTPTNTPTATPTIASSTPTNTATATPTQGEQPPGGGSEAVCLNATEQAFLNLLNQYRVQNGVGPLAVSATLNTAAYNHSRDMSDNNYFSHNSPNGDTPWDRMADAGYDYNTYKGENIARGYASAQAVFDGWRNSPGHNANMLNPNFNVIGIGYVSDGHYWTTDFGGHVDAPPGC